MGEPVSERLARVLALDGEAFDEIAADERSTGTALAVVFGVAAACGVGQLFTQGVTGFLLAALEVCLRFGLWLLVAQAALVALGRPDRFAPLFRVLGFAAAPAALGLLVELPLVGGLVGLLQWALGFAVAWRAIERAAGLDLPEAAILCGASLFSAFWLASRITAMLA